MTAEFRELVERGAGTRFGQAGGADPRFARSLAISHSSFRLAVRQIGCYQVPAGKQPTIHNLLKAFGKKSPNQVQRIAAALVHAALNGNVKAMHRLETIIDGKIR